MGSQKGITLLEVLIALSLLSISAFAALKQQWYSLQCFNRLHAQAQALMMFDNASENPDLASMDKGSQTVHVLRTCLRAEQCTLSLNWTDAQTSNLKSVRLHRRVYYAF